MKPASELTKAQRKFITKSVHAIEKIAVDIEPTLTTREFCECMERLYVHAINLLPKYEEEENQTSDEQTITE